MEFPEKVLPLQKPEKIADWWQIVQSQDNTNITLKCFADSFQKVVIKDCFLSCTSLFFGKNISGFAYNTSENVASH